MPDKRKVYWDSCLFYEYLGNEDVSARWKAGLQKVLGENKKGENVILTSVVAHLEVLPEKLETKKPGAEAAYLALFDAKRFVEVEVSTNIIMRAREIRDFYYRPADQYGVGAKMMDAGDAIHLATATIHQADVFHTRDNCNKRGNVPLLTMKEMFGVDRVCGKYSLEIISPEEDQGDLYG